MHTWLARDTSIPPEQTLALPIHIYPLTHSLLPLSGFSGKILYTNQFRPGETTGRSFSHNSSSEDTMLSGWTSNALPGIRLVHIAASIVVLARQTSCFRSKFAYFSLPRDLTRVIWLHVGSWLIGVVYESCKLIGPRTYLTASITLNNRFVVDLGSCWLQRRGRWRWTLLLRGLQLWLWWLRWLRLKRRRLWRS